jgi:hypothetical protein
MTTAIRPLTQEQSQAARQARTQKTSYKGQKTLGLSFSTIQAVVRSFAWFDHQRRLSKDYKL